MITEKDVRNIAKLSSLYIADEDIEKLTKDMQDMADFAQMVKAFDTESETFEKAEENFCDLREDEIKPSCTLEDVLLNTEKSKDGYFLLRKSV